MVWCPRLILGKFQVIIVSNIASVPFSLSYSRIPIILMLQLFAVVPQFSGVFLVFVSHLLFIFWRFLLKYWQNLLSAVSYLISLYKEFFISVITILTFSISFLFFFRISISLLYIYSCMLSALSIGAGVPNPLIGTRPHSRRWTVGKASSLFTATLRGSHCHVSPTSFQISGGTGFS